MALLKDLLEANVDTQTYSADELDKLRELIRDEQNPSLKAEYRKALNAVYKDGRIEEVAPLTWPEFQAANPNGLTLKRWFYGWWTREEASMVREISRHYKIQPSFYSSEEEPPNLAIICYLDPKGQKAYTSVPMPSLAAGGKDESNVLFWLSQKGYRSQKPGVHEIKTYSDYSADEQAAIQLAIRRDSDMHDYLATTIRERFPLEIDIKVGRQGETMKMIIHSLGR